TITQRYLTNDGGHWSPKGQYLAYGSRRASVQGEPGALIIVIRSVQTGEEHELTVGFDDFDLGAWSPDSRFLLMDAPAKEGQWGIYSVDARTGDVAKLYAKTGESFTGFHWFANGKSIVFIKKDKVGSMDKATNKIAIVLRDLE